MNDKKLILPNGSVKRGKTELSYSELEYFEKELKDFEKDIKMIMQDDYDAKLLSIVFCEEDEYVKEKYRIVYGLKPNNERKVILEIHTKYKVFLENEWILVSIDKDYVLEKIKGIIKRMEELENE